MIGGPCRACGVEHDYRIEPVFAIGARVRVKAHERDNVNLVGQVGVVYSTTRYGGPWSIRVQFGRGVVDPAYPDSPQRGNFAPCDLEVVEDAPT